MAIDTLVGLNTSVDPDVILKKSGRERERVCEEGEEGREGERNRLIKDL